MKKLLFPFATMLISLAFAFSSCSDDEPKGSDFDKLSKLPYSSLSPEKQKEKLQNDALDFLSKMEGLQGLEAIKIFEAFNALCEIDSPEPRINDATSIIYLSQLYGTYTWNEENEEWDYTKSNDKTEFVFPVDDKDAKITTTAVASDLTVDIYQEIWDEEEYEYVDVYISIEMPKELTCKAYYSGSSKEEASLVLKSEIKDKNSIPRLTEATYKMGDYQLYSKATTGTPNTATATLSKGSEVLIKANLDLDADLSNALDEEFYPNKMKGNATISIMSALAFTGNMDILKYIEAETAAWDEYEENYNKDAEEKCEKAVAKAFNDNAEIYLVSLDDQTKIARLNCKAKEYSDRWGSWWSTIYTLQFGDDTEVEAEVFFSSGFDQFMEELDNFVLGLFNPQK